MPHIKHWLLALGVALVIVAPQNARARDVRHCGVTIGANKTGRLVKNVSCGARCTSDPAVACSLDPGSQDYVCPIAGSGCVAEMIHLGRNSKLDLNGFDLAAAFRSRLVECSSASGGRCTVRGPGRLLASKETAVKGHSQDVYLQDLTIDHSYGGVKTTGRIVAENVSMTRCDQGLAAGKRMRLRNVILSASCDVSSKKDIFVEHLEGNVSVTAQGLVRGSDVFLSEGWVEARSVFLTNLHAPIASSNALSISSKSVRATGKVVLRDSLVSEIQAGTKPQLVHSTCRTSRNLSDTASWGVCVRD